MKSSLRGSRRTLLLSLSSQVLPSAFTDGSIVIQEVAALVYRNAKTLRALELFSPRNPLHDETPLHSPFSFKPRRFPHLRCLSLVGCQAFEWAHILSNCPLPAVERFEITYFPPPSDHWSWQVCLAVIVCRLDRLGVAPLLRTSDCRSKPVVGNTMRCSFARVGIGITHLSSYYTFVVACTS